MSDEMLHIAGLGLALKRPGDGANYLRGWDAADELLLEHASEQIAGRPDQRVLVVDDQFGALTLGLGRLFPEISLVSLADNATLATALQLNSASMAPVAGPASWLEPPLQTFDLVVLRIPRQADYLAWVLRWCNQVLGPDGVIIAGGMIKHLPDQSSKVFAELVNTRMVSRAWKKARVTVSTPGDSTLESWNAQWQGYDLPESGVRVDALPAVFSRRKLDIGTRELLPAMGNRVVDLPAGSRLLDLACGNGVLGLAALSLCQDLEVIFSDVSSQAVLSARHNVGRAFPQALTRFVHCDGMPPGTAEFDLILLNPPFHEGGVVGDHIALTLFRQAAARLAPGGRVLVVGNRHLGYHRSLKTSFSLVRQLASSPKFVVFEAGHQPP
ncbi:class I SAM-dependent methyltransferase [Marinobacter halotolerans]|uniref:class I SAM-dependent methyltransferase n=1 Tax=Marinobacter halotolerans TaxID=1569211 RepID=UPI0012488EAC|nr:methyltransferase [Marinobacter halotolerans]